LCHSTVNGLVAHEEIVLSLKRFSVPIRKGFRVSKPMTGYPETGRPARRWRNIAIALIDGESVYDIVARTNRVKRPITASGLLRILIRASDPGQRGRSEQ
jgi:hypothetical protein